MDGFVTTTIEWPPDEASPPGSTQTDHAARKYRGEVASSYDAKRMDSPKWLAENRIVADMLKDIPRGSSVLDCPVGTGRFLSLYRERGLTVIAMDISPDMLAEARKKWDGRDDQIVFETGDIRQTGLLDKSVDVALAVRLFNWFEPIDVVHALRELQRIARVRIIFNVRVRNHPRTRGYDLIKISLNGWHIARDDEIVENYQMIALEPNV